MNIFIWILFAVLNIRLLSGISDFNLFLELFFWLFMGAERYEIAFFWILLEIPLQFLILPVLYEFLNKKSLVFVKRYFAMTTKWHPEMSWICFAKKILCYAQYDWIIFCPSGGFSGEWSRAKQANTYTEYFWQKGITSFWAERWRICWLLWILFALLI